MRQRIRRAVGELPGNLRPPQSRQLDVSIEFQVEAVELRRLRIEQWRVVYAIDVAWDIVTVLAVRKRPPYTYDDLRELLGRL
jgi:mRNA interferase RelE/StbE